MSLSCSVDEMSSRIDDLVKEVDRLAAKVRERLRDDGIERRRRCCWGWAGHAEENGRMKDFTIIVFVDHTPSSKTR